MATNVKLEGNDSKRKAYSVTASVTAADRLLRALVDGKPRDFERVGTDTSGTPVYRDQNRRPVR